MINISRSGKESSREYAYRVIRENIMTLHLEPGQLLSEYDLSEKLGVSRTPIREAFIKLADEKLMEIYPQKGSFVSKIDKDAVEEISHTRKFIEKEILKLSMENKDESMFKEIEKNLYFQKGNIELEGTLDELFSLDNQFHKLIYRSAKKEKTWVALNYVSSHYDRVRFIEFFFGRESKLKAFNQHKKIFEIIKNKDMGAIDQIIEEHISNFKENIEVMYEKYSHYF